MKIGVDSICTAECSRTTHVEKSTARYFFAELEDADSPRIEHLTERLASLRGRLGELEAIAGSWSPLLDQRYGATCGTRSI